MNRSKLVAATAALTLTLAACSNGDGDTGSETTSEAGSTESASGDLTATVSDAQVADDGTVTLTVETDEGTEELQTSSAAYITAPSAAGGTQRTRLTTWLENNEFDGSTEFEIRQRDGVVTDLRAV